MKPSTVEAKSEPGAPGAPDASGASGSSNAPGASSAYKFRAAEPADAQSIVSCYESVFGPGGVRAPGHEPYPAPEVFSISGVLQILKDSQRQFMVMEVEGEIAGGMIISLNSQFHREFGCVAVSKRYQGRGLSVLMLKEAKTLEQQKTFSINVTEIVTHSMLSQSAHRNAGFDLITGFGFCQYPHVFFANHPESCLWITSFEGSVAQTLRQSRPSRNRAYVPASKNTIENQEHHSLVESLQKQRSIFVSQSYSKIVSRIAAQFDDIFTYRMYCHASKDSDSGTGVLELEYFGDYPYAYLTFPSEPISDDELLKCVSAIKANGKRYIQARVNTNHASAIGHIELLKRFGFFFLGWVPLFQQKKEKAAEFDDILIMQWVKPEVLERNFLPGESASVAKLHGFPLNLTGELIATMRRDLAEMSGRNRSD